MTSVGYANQTAVEQMVAIVVGPPGGGAGGSFSSGPSKPEGVTVIGVNQQAAEGQIRVAAAGQYVDVDVFVGGANRSARCDAWIKATVGPLAGG